MEPHKLRCHKALYKSPRGRTLPWKDVYRRRCFDRFRASRDSLIEQIRVSNDKEKYFLLSSKNEASNRCSPGKLVQGIMEEEWCAINNNRSFPSLNKDALLSASSGEDSDEELTRELLLEIQDELIGEEEVTLNEFLKFDAKLLESQIAMFQEREVICPVCKIRKLSECQSDGASLWPGDGASNNNFLTPPKCSAGNKKSVLMCGCGVVLSREGLSLDMVQAVLQHTITHHEQSCSMPLSFSSTCDPNGTNILITCSSCDWMSYLL